MTTIIFIANNGENSIRFFRPIEKVGGMLLILLLVLLFTGCEKLDWSRTVRKNTIPGYEYFMRKHPHSPLLMDASEMLKKLHFAEAKKINVIPAFELFLKRYSRDELADSARFYIEKLAFENTKNIYTVPAVQEFLQYYSPYFYADSAYKLLDQLYSQRHPDFRNVKTARVIVNRSLGENGNLNEFINLPFERLVADLMTSNGIHVKFGGADHSDMVLTVNVTGGIIKSQEVTRDDSISVYGISLDMHFSAQAEGKEPLIYRNVHQYHPPVLHRITSIASQEFFEAAFWQPGSFPTRLATLLSQCFGPSGALSLLSKNDNMQPHIIQALTIMGEPISDILYEKLQGINDKSVAIASILCRLGDVRVKPFLVDLLHSENRAFHMQSMQLLEMIPDTNSIEPLVAFTRQRRERERCLLAIKTLGFIQHEKSAAHLRELLQDRDRDIRKVAVLALGYQKNADNVSHLIGMFDDSERQVANTAMDVLTTYGDMVIDSLIKSLQANKASTVWRAMVILGELKAEAAIDDIIPLLNHPNNFTSWKAREVLGKFKSDRVVKAMLSALHDPEMVGKAAAVLGYIGVPEAVQPLITCYEADSSYSFLDRVHIIRTLGRLKDPVAVEFLIDILNSDQIVLQTEAARALGKIGDPRALPVLDEWYQKNDMALRIAILETYGDFQNPKQTQRIAKALKEEHDDLRTKALEILGDSGDDSVIEDLVMMLNDPFHQAQNAARNGVLNFGEAAIPYLSTVLHSKLDRSLRNKVVYALKDTKSDLAVAPLIKALNDPDTYLVSSVQIALQSFGEPAVPPLLKLLRSGNWLHRKRATEILSRNREPRAVPEFITILKGNDNELKRDAAFLVGELKYYPAVPLLIDCLGEAEMTLVVEVTIALGKIGSAEATPAILAGLESGNTALVVESAKALGNIKDARAINGLIDKTRSRNEEIRKAANEALVNIGAPAVEPLLSLMAESDHFTIKNTADILAQIGTPAVPGLLKMINNTSTTSWYAVEALGKIKDERAIQPLTAALDFDDGYYYLTVRSALANIGRPAFDQVVSLLHSEDSDQRWKAVETIYAFREPSMTKYLITAIDDQEWRVRFAASKYLQSISGEKYGMNTRKWRKWYNDNMDRFGK